eukprot:COSAG05_NODE_1172_length_5623_cov_3.561188_2_plen_370_part_00
MLVWVFVMFPLVSRASVNHSGSGGAWSTMRSRPKRKSWGSVNRTEPPDTSSATTPITTNEDQERSAAADATDTDGEAAAANVSLTALLTDLETPRPTSTPQGLAIYGSDTSQRCSGLDASRRSSAGSHGSGGAGSPGGGLGRYLAAAITRDDQTPPSSVLQGNSLDVPPTHQTQQTHATTWSGLVDSGVGGAGSLERGEVATPGGEGGGTRLRWEEESKRGDGRSHHGDGATAVSADAAPFASTPLLHQGQNNGGQEEGGRGEVGGQQLSPPGRQPLVPPAVGGQEGKAVAATAVASPAMFKLKQTLQVPSLSSSILSKQASLAPFWCVCLVMIFVFVWHHGFLVLCYFLGLCVVACVTHIVGGAGAGG